MNIMLNLQPEIEKGLLAQALERGVSFTDYVNKLVIRQALYTLNYAKRTGRELIEASAKVLRLLTDEEADMLFSRNRPEAG